MRLVFVKFSRDHDLQEIFTDSLGVRAGYANVYGDQAVAQRARQYVGRPQRRARYEARWFDLHSGIDNADVLGKLLGHAGMSPCTLSLGAA